MASPPAGPLERLLGHKRAVLGIALLALLLGLPALRIGFYSDDYAQVALVEQRIPTLRGSPLDAYRMVGDDPAEREAFVARGPLPWWTDPGFRLRFFRPITSLVFALDNAVYGRNPLGYHVTTVVLYALLILALALLYRRALSGDDRAGEAAPPALGLTAALALLLFAVDDAHGLVLCWIACRHLTITALPAVLALTAHLRYRQEGWSPGRVLGPLGLVAAFLCGEAAVGALSYWLAYDLFGPAPRTKEGGYDTRSRLLAALPAVVILGAYTVAYKTFGFGVRGSGAYIEPGANPLDFLLALSWRAPALLGDFFTGLSADATAIFPKAPFVALGLVSTAAMALLYRALRAHVAEEERVALRWLLPGALGGLLISCGGFLGTRLLFFPSIGGAVLIAVLLRAAGRRLAARAPDTRLLGLRAARGALILVHLLAPPLLLLNQSTMITGFAREGAEAARSAEIRGPEPGHVVVVWASDPMVNFYPPTVIIFDAIPHPGNTWHQLSTAKGAQEVTRSGPRSLRIKSLEIPMLQGAFDQVFYSPRTRFHEGQRFQVEGLSITVVATKDGAPTEIEARFDLPLDDPSLHLVAWLDGKLRKIPLPREGESLHIDWTPGPYQLF